MRLPAKSNTLKKEYLYLGINKAKFAPLLLKSLHSLSISSFSVYFLILFPFPHPLPPPPLSSLVRLPPSKDRPASLKADADADDVIGSDEEVTILSLVPPRRSSVAQLLAVEVETIPTKKTNESKTKDAQASDTPLLFRYPPSFFFSLLCLVFSFLFEETEFVTLFSLVLAVTIEKKTIEERQNKNNVEKVFFSISH